MKKVILFIVSSFIFASCATQIPHAKTTGRNGLIKYKSLAVNRRTDMDTKSRSLNSHGCYSTNGQKPAKRAKTYLANR